jgi:ketosteroid isomerase-like protein
MNVAALIERYYANVDAAAIDEVVAMFAKNAVYERAGTIYRGLPAISNFFRHERLIRGIHRIEEIASWGQRAFAAGWFDGAGVSGDARQVGFVDLWHFDENGSVIERRTYLNTGHDIILR